MSGRLDTRDMGRSLRIAMLQVCKVHLLNEAYRGSGSGNPGNGYEQGFLDRPRSKSWPHGGGVLMACLMLVQEDPAG